MSAANPLTWTLRSIARIERPDGLRKPRLTEPGHVKWHRMRRRLDWIDFIELLHEDLATTFPWPYDLGRWQTSPISALTPRAAEELVGEAARPDDSDALTFLRAAARGLGLPAGGNIADLPRVATHQKVLELASGRIAFQQVQTYTDLAFHEQFTFVADSDAERLLIGLASVELRANPPRILRPAELRQLHLEGQRFDRVLGIKGHAWAEALTDQLKLEVRWT